MLWSRLAISFALEIFQLMNLKTIALVCAVASLGAPLSVHAADAPTASSQPESAGRSAAFPEFSVLTPEEQAKFKAATEATKKDPKLQALQRKVLAAIKELRDGVEASMIAADPSMEPILRKLKEAREKELANGAPRPAK